MQIPSQILAGETASWREVSLRDSLGQSVDSGAYALTFSFRGPVVAGNLDLAGAAFGSGWQFALTAAQSSAFNAGATPVLWYWQAKATKAGSLVMAGSGTLTVLPNLSNLPTNQVFDGSTQAEKDLAAVQAEIRARTSGGLTVEYTIGSRSLKKEPVEALLALEQRCKRIVARERAAERIKNGLGNPGRVGVRFK